MQKTRAVVQLVFLGVFLLLMITGKAQFWMAFIFISIILSSYIGRYYCGWMCPINTLMRPVSYVKKKLGIHESAVPSILHSGDRKSVV